MAQRIILKDCHPGDLGVKRERIGISYSGGGPLCIIELGVARAFVERGIIPDVVTGVSAGALAGVAHALDVRKGLGIEMGIEIYAEVKDRVLGLAWQQMLWRALRYRYHLTSLGDNEPLKRLVTQAIKRFFGITGGTIGMFKPPDYPLFMVGATNRLDGAAFWFPDETPLEEALVASSAIPGVFPWRELVVEGQTMVLVDGGVVANQPISNLVLQGCGTIYSCLVGYPDGSLPPPRNAPCNAWGSLQLQQHQCMKLEAAYAQLKLGDHGNIYCLRPDVRMPVSGYDLSGSQIQQVVEEARRKALDWLDHGMPDPV